MARLNWRLATHPVDVFHQLHTNISPIKPCPGRDPTAYHYFEDPVLFATRPYRYYCWALRHRADLVIAISEATRDDFHRYFGVPLASMRTVHPGLSKSFGSASRPASARPYLLSPYNLSASKNLRSLILAWPAIADRHHDVELILFGRGQVSPESEAEFEQLLQGLSHAHRIRRVGHVPDEELSALYEGCALFVFPTTVEGFGYPLLEAMAHGACCITRDRSAMKELGGDAVVLVETLRPDEIAGAAIDLLEDPSRRSCLGERATRRAAQFTVEAMVRRHARLLPHRRRAEPSRRSADWRRAVTDRPCAVQHSPPHPRARIVEIRVAFEAVGPLSSAKGRSDGLDGQGQGAGRFSSFLVALHRCRGWSRLKWSEIC